MVPVICLMAVAAAPAGGNVEILEFSATWCGPCRTIAPAIERLQAAGYPFRKIDVDQSPQIAQQHKVTHLPTIVVLRDGQEIGRRVGARSYVELVRWLKKLDVGPVSARPAPPILRGQSPDGHQPPTAASPPRRPQPATETTMPAATRPVAPAPHNHQPAAPATAPRHNSAVAAPPRASGAAQAAAVERALAASVRLRVEDQNGFSFGSGTIIDVSGADALVVTCGHIFRDSQGKGKITVDLFAGGQVRSVEGRLLAYEADKRDIGFVVIRPGSTIAPVPVATKQQQLQVGLAAFSIGCNRGAAPTVEQTRVTAVNRYAHGPNLEIEGQPVDGRSGGGLFSTTGELIGVCNAADFQENKGLYASLPLVHEYLAKLGLNRLIRDASPGTPAPAAASFVAGTVPASERTAPAAASIPSATAPVTPPLGAVTRASELICVVRDPQTGRERVIVVRQPTAQLISQLEAASRPVAGSAPVAQVPSGATRVDGGPIMRAQSRD